MITRIKRVRHYRALRTWSYGPDVAEFGAVNVVYGVNGSGKSTLCSLLQDAPSDLNWSTGLELEISAANTKRPVNSASDPFWQKLRVFNRAYVEANLRFDESGAGANHLLALGETRIDIEERRGAARASLVKIDDKLVGLQAAKTTAEGGRAELLRDTARTISEELGHLGGRYRPRSYDASSIERRLADGFAAPGEVDVSTELATVRANAFDAVVAPTPTLCSLERIADHIREVLAQSAVAAVIEDLRDHPDWNRWVQEGLALHGDRDTCIYCASPLTRDRRDVLARHFDDSLVRLQARISDLESELTSMRETCTAAVHSLPAPEALFPQLRQEFVQARNSTRAQVARWERGVGLLFDALARKRDALFSALEVPEPPELLEVTFDEVHAVLHQHNQISSTFHERQAAAAERIELAHITEIRDRVAAFATQVRNLDAEMRELIAQQRAHQAELARLTVEDLDPVPIAEHLNGDLSRLLGRSDLVFEIETDGYQITRDGKAASHLSEGERNAVALLYFLHSLDSNGTELAECVVVIDDPVSSLDANALFGASSHLWSRLVHEHRCGQLFLFTHNFELFRHWSGLLQRSQESRVKVDYRLLEMHCGIQQLATGQLVRSLRLASWPSGVLEKRLRSEYQYLFWRVATTLRECRETPTVEHEIEAASVLPNVCRRLLEGFLGFKSPAHLGNLYRQVDDAARELVPEATRERVHRFLDYYSHSEEADTTKVVARPEAVEMLHVVLEYMKAVDPGHFSAMCEAIEVDGTFVKDAVLREVPSPAGERRA